MKLCQLLQMGRAHPENLTVDQGTWGQEEHPRDSIQEALTTQDMDNSTLQRGHLALVIHHIRKAPLKAAPMEAVHLEGVQHLP